MRNKDIAKLLKLAGSLLELHDENEFKVRSFYASSFNIDRLKQPLIGLTESELAQIQGIGKGIAGKIFEITTKNTFKELQDLLEKTPKGVVAMLKVKGIGPKKVKSLWKDLHIESTEALLQACYQNKVASLKGFGEKIQEEIIDYLELVESSKGKFHFADVFEIALELEEKLKDILPSQIVRLSGDIPRKMEIVENMQFLVSSNDHLQTFEKIKKVDQLSQNEKKSSPFIWNGVIRDTDIHVQIKLYLPEQYESQWYIHSSSEKHLSEWAFDKISLFNFLKNNTFNSEKEIFEKLNWQPIPVEMREGLGEVTLAKNQQIPILVNDQDLKGILHNHTDYSDGTNTLTEMAVACKEMGYEYVGISDHSQSATYASGLTEDKIFQQHKEIDELNAKLAPFKIFKGIESDILNDGSLDYPDDILKTFDFIVASIHSNLKMDIHKATTRLIKAIENPYTTMLGHPTGRLLLNRKAYPIDHKKVIDACAANGVIIEINADPWRLDLDWHWVPYAMNKGVMLSINPDAHEIEGYLNMQFGVCVGRKGGLTKVFVFNALGRDEVAKYLNNRIKSRT
ncbi:MAG: PHP domain-containing protein [Bacteroidota bacterium]|nr:PHP domain-containing protein [Bacteroidota bacterium]